MAEEGEEAVEDTEEEEFADIIITVVIATVARFFSEPMEELESASMHSDASSGSEPEPQPEEEEDEEQEKDDEEGGQTEELVEAGLLGWSVLPSTKTFPQLLLLSLLQGEPEDQGEGSYCESKPGCSRPRGKKNTVKTHNRKIMPSVSLMDYINICGFNSQVNIFQFPTT